MFVGRRRELGELEGLYQTGSFQMVVVYGRRRVGKTALIREFGKGKDTLYFTALDQTDKGNLADFSRSAYAFFGLPESTGAFATWSDALGFVADQARGRRFVFVFDEFPYAARRNASLPSALQIAIDHDLKNTGLFLVLCGSNQGFMEGEVLGRKSPLYGRRTAQMKIDQFGYLEAAEMLPGIGPQELFRYYGCFGGVPYYLEQIDASKGFLDNVARLYFSPSGFLYDEPFGLLRQEFDEPAIYSSVLRAIAGGANKQKEIADRIGVGATTLPKYLKALASIGVIEKRVPFGENPEASKHGIYGVRDACYDFWFRFVMPYASDIEEGLGGAVARRLPGQQVDAYLGRRFERLCAEWLAARAVEGALPFPVTSVGSWWGTDPARCEQADIDVLAADKLDKRLLIGECKYRESFDESAVLDGLEQKRRLVRGYEATNLAVFSKHPLSEATRAKLAARDDVLLVTLEEMYGA